MSNKPSDGLTRELKTQAIILGGFVAFIWLVEIVDVFLRGSLDRFGILPRHAIGLRGILFAPFLHGGFGHLAANTIPLVTLGWFSMLRRTSDFFLVSVITILVGGLGTWLFGRAFDGGIPVFHIGASGLIFGYLGFLLLRGYFERNIPSILFSVIVGFLYGGLLWGVLPSAPGISWEGHLFGFIGGGLTAWLVATQRKQTRPF